MNNSVEFNLHTYQKLNGCLSETVDISNGSSFHHHQVENEKCTVEGASFIAHHSFMYLHFLPDDCRTIETCPREVVVVVVVVVQKV